MIESRRPSAIRRTFVCMVLVLAAALSQADLRSTARGGRIAEPIALITPVTPELRNTSVSGIEIVFSEAVTGVTLDDFTLTRDFGGDLLTGAQTVTTSDNVTWTLGDLTALTGSQGIYTLTLIANGSIINGGSEPLTVGHYTTWFMDTTGPSVTINQAVGQADPVGYDVPVEFRAVFTEEIDANTFTSADIDLSLGTATATTVTVSQIAPHDGTTFSVTLDGTSPGNLVATVPAGAVTDVPGNLNPTPSTSIDNSVTILSCAEHVTATSTADSGPGSLRNAIADVCANGEIEFDIAGPGPHTITLASPLEIDKLVDIIGSETESVILDGGGISQLMQVDVAGNVLIAHLTFANGYSTGEGAAIMNFGFVQVLNSLFTGNLSDLGGGAITNDGQMVLINTTVSGNSTGGVGGGIFNRTGLGLLNSTVTNNHAGDLGGGLYNIFVFDVVNTIIAGNTAVNDGDNLMDGADGVTDDYGDNILGGDAMIGPLQDNGGPTLSHAPLPGSPAIDEANSYFIGLDTLPYDQRGSPFSRYRDGADADDTKQPDIGAIEADPAVENIPNKTTAEGVALAVPFRVGDVDSAFEPIVVTSSNTTLLPNGNLVLAQDSASEWTLTLTPAPDLVGTSTITVTVSKIIAGTLVSMSDTFVLTVTPLPDTPSITGATTLEDTLSTGGLVISPSALDGAEVTHFKITAVTGGTLFKTDGVTSIAPTTFITASEGATGLRFLPAPNTFGLGQVSVQASASASNAGLGGDPATGVVTVFPVADTPSISNAHTTINQQTTSGLVITRNPADGAEVTHFQITATSGGQLFQTDGQTPIALNAFISAAEGAAGLAFTPSAGSIATGHLSVRASVSGASPGLGGGTATADITVTGPGVFTDDPLVPGQTVIRVVHLLELRARINAQRVRFGLAAINLHDPVAGVSVITRLNLLQVRTALSQAYDAAGVPAPTYTDPLLPPGTLIKAAHIQELRTAIRALEGR